MKSESKLILNDKTANDTRLIVSNSTKTDGIKLRLSNRMDRYEQPHGASNYIILDESQIEGLISDINTRLKESKNET